MPSCLHVLLRVTRPLCSLRGGCHFGYVPLGVGILLHAGSYCPRKGGGGALGLITSGCWGEASGTWPCVLHPVWYAACKGDGPGMLAVNRGTSGGTAVQGSFRAMWSHTVWEIVSPFLPLSDPPRAPESLFSMSLNSLTRSVIKITCNHAPLQCNSQPTGGC